MFNAKNKIEEWPSTQMLHSCLLPEQGSTGRQMEGAFGAVREDLLDGLTAEDEAFLRGGYRSLHRLYSLLVASATKTGHDPEGELPFTLGRLAEQVEIAAAALRRTRPRAFQTEVDHEKNWPILKALSEGEASSTHLLRLLAGSGAERMEKATMSRTLDRLEKSGLVMTHRVGRNRRSRLTAAGRQAVELKMASELEGTPRRVDEVIGDLKPVLMQPAA